MTERTPGVHSSIAAVAVPPLGTAVLALLQFRWGIALAVVTVAVTVAICHFVGQALRARSERATAAISCARTELSFAQFERDRAAHEANQLTATRRDLQARVLRQSMHDALTDLPNRPALLEALGRLATDPILSRRSALIFIDLDDFKHVNGALGYALGDELLRQLANRLRHTLRPGDFAARLAGDEFVVITSPVVSLLAAEGMAERIAMTVSGRYALGRETAIVRTSVGVALTRPDCDPLDLLRDANVAVYQAKQLGKGRVATFDDAVRQRLKADSELEQALADAIDRKAIELHYQPIVDFAGNLAGMEALARWDCPGRGSVSPAVFIPVAERTSMICDLGRNVLAEAVAALAAWKDLPGLSHAYLTVNISGRHLASGSLVNDVSNALFVRGVAPERLVIEIAESALFADVPGVADQLNELRRLGVRISIDDFGASSTSVMMLRYLAADVVKVDRVLISQLDRDPGSPLVKIVVDVAHSLGMSVVAEGVETAAELAALQRLGCDQMQGFLTGRPVPAVELERRWSAGRVPAGNAP